MMVVTLTDLADYLDRTADLAVLPVAVEMLTEGSSPGAAPGIGEPSGVGAGVVSNTPVDKGELAGSGTGGAAVSGVGGISGTVVSAVPPEALDVVGESVGSCAAPGPREAACSGAGGVTHSLEPEGEHAGRLYHGPTHGVAGSCRGVRAILCSR